jgi:hypothetical protein
MPDPKKYEVRKGQTTKIGDIELVHRIICNQPSTIKENPRLLEFRWQKLGPETVSKLTIEYLGPKPEREQPHPSYKTLKIRGFSYKVPVNHPLYPGDHRFGVVTLTPALRVYAECEWVYFTVPGD